MIVSATDCPNSFDRAFIIKNIYAGCGHALELKFAK